MNYNILVPLDGSMLAETVLPYAQEFALKCDARISLLRVIEYTPEGLVPKEGVFALETIEQHYIEKLGQELIDKSIDARAEIRIGNPAKEILQFASEEKTDLVIMAARGRSGLRRRAPGNTADTVIRSTDQSVLLIRALEHQHKVPRLRLLEKVLVPLDGSKEAAMAIPLIEDLAIKLNMEIILFMAVQKGSYVYPVGGDGAFKIIPFSREQIKAKKADARAYLEAVALELRNKGITVKSEVTYGDVAKEIIKSGDRDDVDLVAMSTWGRFGSIANKFLREGNNHLLLLREKVDIADA